MRPQKASRPATELTVNEPRRDSAWRQSLEAKANLSPNQAARFRVSGYTIPPEPRRVTLADIETMLTVLPYGMWTCADGRVVIFNRHYTPIWERLPDGTVHRADSNEWVDWTEQGWFDLGSMRYEKSAREAYRKVLQDFLDAKPLTVANDTRRVRP
jgi:crotonobetainyl-CoA:carnitine CoA-transferase CaiB-like acyl-CoA transferase